MNLFPSEWLLGKMTYLISSYQEMEEDELEKELQERQDKNIYFL